MWTTWIKLSKRLIIEHQEELDELKISYIDNRFKTTVDMIALLQQREKIECISTHIKTILSFFRTYFLLTIIAFLMVVVLGFISVMMSWN
jgi:hypothetical protein